MDRRSAISARWGLETWHQGTASAGSILFPWVPCDVAVTSVLPPGRNGWNKRGCDHVQLNPLCSATLLACGRVCVGQGAPAGMHEGQTGLPGCSWDLRVWGSVLQPAVVYNRLGTPTCCVVAAQGRTSALQRRHPGG